MLSLSDNNQADVIGAFTLLQVSTSIILILNKW